MMARKKKAVTFCNKKDDSSNTALSCQDTESVNETVTQDSNDRYTAYYVFLLVTAAALTGQIWQTPGLDEFALYAMTFAAYISFFAMSLVRDHSGGRFILLTGQIFAWCAASLFAAISPDAEICHMLLLLLVPLYFVFSMFSFMKHFRNRTLNLLPGTVFKGTYNR